MCGETRNVRGSASGCGCLVVPLSRSLDSARVGKNLPAKREDDPQSERVASVFFGGSVRKTTHN